MARFFRDFGENDNTKVVLVGFMHIELYRIFFVKIGLNPIISVSNVEWLSSAEHINLLNTMLIKDIDNRVHIT